jgi:hypothetical protein
MITVVLLFILTDETVLPLGVLSSLLWKANIFILSEIFEMGL